MDNAFFPWSAVFGFDGSVPIHRPDLFGLNVSSDKEFTILLGVAFALFSIAILALRRGPFGRVLVDAKDSEAACATLGLSLTTTKLAVFTLSAATAGIAGALFGAAQAVAGGTAGRLHRHRHRGARLLPRRGPAPGLLPRQPVLERALGSPQRARPGTRRGEAR